MQCRYPEEAKRKYIGYYHFQISRSYSRDLKKLSLLGRILVIKMNVLPKMLFLLQSIPLINNAGDFRKWQKDIIRFIWQGENPRIKYKLLIDSKDRGGFSLPDLRLYYEASCLCWLGECILFKNSFQISKFMTIDKVGMHFCGTRRLKYIQLS